MRSIAVYLVLFFHAGLVWAGGGFIGVDLFFVLSGFLVSNVILSELDQTGRLRLGRFYSRRIRRLLPAAVVVIAATSLMFVLVASVVRRIPLVADAQSSLLYVANWRFLAESNDYFATDLEPSPFLHFWSLAIEEQFYVVFPVLLLLLYTFARRRAGVVLGALSVLMVLSLGAQLYWSQIDVNHAYYGTDARLYQLLAGAVTAVALRARGDRAAPRTAGVAALVGLAGVLVLGTGLVEVSATWRGVGATAATVALVAGTMLGTGTILSRLLARPAPVYLGRISYGTYLWHWPVILVLKELLTVGPTGVAVLSVGMATGLAALSYEVLEMPIRRKGLLDRFRWKIVLVGVSASALVAVTVVPVVLQSNRRPALAVQSQVTSGAVGTQGGPVPGGIDWKAVFRDEGESRSCPAAQAQRCIVVHGNGPHILVVGDSHAKMFSPMFEDLARAHDFTLSLNIVSGCGWQAGLVNLAVTKPTRDKCTAARSEWYAEALPRLKPDLVILISKPREAGRWLTKVAAEGGSDESVEEMNVRTTRETLDVVVSSGARALLVDTMMGTGNRRPLECLIEARSTSDCVVPVPIVRPVVDAYYGAAAAASPMVFNTNLNPVFCPDEPLCAPILDGTVVWRDRHHLTAQIAVQRRAGVWRDIVESGALAGIT